MERCLAERGDTLWWLAHTIGSPDVQVVLERVARAPGSTPFEYAPFLERARMQAKVVHPSVVRVLEVGTAGDDLLVVHAYVPGWSLEAIVAACAEHRHPLPLAFGCAVMVAALRGLGAAHRTGLVHSSLDLSEIRVTPEGLAKVKGFARPRPPKHGRYRSPEELRGEPVTAASDVFTAALMLYELLSGRPVFGELPEDATSEALLFTPLLDLKEVSPSVPSSLAEAVMAALDRNRTRARVDAEELARRVEDAASALTLTAAERAAFLDWLGRHALTGAQAADRPAPVTGPDEAEARLAPQDPVAPLPAPPRGDVPPRLRALAWVFVVGLGVSVSIAVLGEGRPLRLLLVHPEGELQPLPPSALVPKKPPPDFLFDRSPERRVPSAPGPDEPARRAAPPARDEKTGAVTLVTDPVAEVHHRGHRLGKTPLFQTQLPVGIQTLEFVLPDGRRKKVPVQIDEGKTAAFRFDLSGE